MKKVLSTALGTLAILGNVITPAHANTYNWNKYVGNVYVSTGEIYQNANGGMTAIAKVGLPTCGSNYILKGYIVFNYKSDNGGHFSNYKYDVYGKEGRDVSAFVNVPNVKMSENGTYNLKDNTWCESTIENVAGNWKNTPVKIELNPFKW